MSAAVLKVLDDYPFLRGIPRIDHQDATNVDSKGMAFTIRSVFIIDPSKKIRLILSYPASTGRNTAEVLRVVDSLQTGDKHKVTTPINWVPGDDVIVAPSVNNEQVRWDFCSSFSASCVSLNSMICETDPPP